MNAIQLALGCGMLFVLSTPLMAQQARKPVPADADVQAATKLVAEVYKKDYDGAKTPTEKQALARKMLGDAARTTDDLTSAYALCQVARKIAVGIGDVETAMQATQQLGDRFDIDRGELQSEVFQEVAPLAKLPADQLALARYIGRALPALIKAENFETAQALAAQAVAAAKKSKDADAVKTWAWRQERLVAQAKAFAETQPAQATLKTSPADAAANGTAGTYACFWKEDWQRGLPLLALSGEQPWQTLAERELKGTPTQADQLALADAWYDAAVTAQSPAKEAALRRVALQYQRLIGQQTPLVKRRLEARLAEIGDLASPFPKDLWIDVLELVDVDKHALAQQWTREGLAVSRREPKYTKSIAVPVIAEGSYELRIVAERLEGPEVLFVGLSKACNGAGFALNCYQGRHSGLHLLNGKAAKENGTRTAPATIPAGKPYALTLEVQRSDDKAGIQARLDNRPYFQWVGAAEGLGAANARREDRITLSVTHSSIVIYSVQFKRKSGAAWLAE